jgi:hypothetical protein
MPEKHMFEAKCEKKPFSLGVRWHSRLSLLSGREWQKPLTQKERGQLKLLANALGPLTHEVIDWALENWLKFARRAESAAGLTTFPTEPHIGFLLAHCGVAVNMMQSVAEAKMKNKEDEEWRKEWEVESQQREAAMAEKAANLAEENRISIEQMLVRFAAAGEPPPPITYNNCGEVIRKMTSKERW